MKKEIKKKAYKEPSLMVMGRIIKETQGMNGSSIDGNNSYTQSGGGND